MSEAIQPHIPHTPHSTVKTEERQSSMRPRPVDYDWSQLDIHWYKGDPQITHTINVLNLLLPEGETWFVRVFASCLKYIDQDNRELRQDIRGFMGQEAHHANAHQELLDYLNAHDISTDPYTDVIAWALRTALGEDPFGKEIKNSRTKRVWNTFRLSAVAALEHVTGFLGSWVLNTKSFDDEAIDQTMVDLIRWHGAEEVEHQSVALDILEDVAPRSHHLWRTGAFVIAFPILFVAWVEGVRHLMREDDTIEHGPTWREHFARVKTGELPSILELFKTVPRLLNPDYDPRITEAENMQLAIAQIAKSHGADMV